MTTRALVVDDEPLARKRLRELLADFAEIECVGEAVDGASAVHAIDTLRPDLVFLDVEMPAGSGLDVLDRVTHEPAVIFTTAYDKYAVTAFELHAVDYLLKPFGRERLARALERVISNVGATDGSEATGRRARAALAAKDVAQMDRILVRDRGRLVPVLVRDIVRLEAGDDYTSVHTKGRTYLVYLALQDFERMLDGAKYVRIHRSHVVNLDHVLHFTPVDGGRFQLEMTDGTKLPVSRAYAKALRDIAV
jgi:two-component system LytT family response regulator